MSGLADPTADGLCRDVLRRIGREGRDRGRGQVAGIGWAHAEAAASLASNGSGGLQGLRDAAIIRVMSDTLARISEIAALRCAAGQCGSGRHRPLIRASKSDQAGRRINRYLAAAHPRLEVRSSRAKDQPLPSRPDCRCESRGAGTQPNPYPPPVESLRGLQTRIALRPTRRGGIPNSTPQRGVSRSFLHNQASGVQR